MHDDSAGLCPAEWSPDGSKIVITHSPDPLINSFFDADISIFDVESKELTPLVENPSSDFAIEWSPDSEYLLYQSDETNRTSNYYKNNKWFIIPVKGGSPRRVGQDFDENLSIIA